MDVETFIGRWTAREGDAERKGFDAVLTWDGLPLPTMAEKDVKRVGLVRIILT